MAKNKTINQENQELMALRIILMRIKVEVTKLYLVKSDNQMMEMKSRSNKYSEKPRQMLLKDLKMRVKSSTQVSLLRELTKERKRDQPVTTDRLTILNSKSKSAKSEDKDSMVKTEIEK